MTRRIVSRSFQATGGGPPVDGYFDRLIKYIPSDIVGAWLVTKNLISAYGKAPPSTLWVAFACGIVLTILVVRLTPNNGPATWFQVAISTVAFVIWSWALGSPLSDVIPHSALFSSLVLIAYTVLVAALVPKE